LIGPKGEQLGIFPKNIALEKADEMDLDLVEISPHSEPPVCRIMDFAKFKYEQEKKEREAKKHHKNSQLKEVRISPRIGDHDYMVKLKHLLEFLKKGHKVRVRMMFKGREMAHQEIGRKRMEQVITDVGDLGKIDRDSKMLGRSLILVLQPK